MIPSLKAFPLFQAAFRNAKARYLHFHEHRFWQLELVREGTFSLILENEELLLGEGSAILISPNISHAFQYPSKPVAWSSFKFGLEGLPGSRSFRRWDLSDVESSISDALWQLARFSDTDLHEQIGLLLEAMLVSRRSDDSPDVSFSEERLSHKAYERVKQLAGQRTTVKEVANLLGYDGDYLSTRFKKETGKSLKGLIDSATATKAKGLLENTQLTASEIADLLGFNDLFSFSRFCKRCLGSSPSHYRILSTGDRSRQDLESK